MISGADYIDIIDRSYDLSDSRTRKKLLYCTEDSKINSLEYLANKLYGFIKQKVDDIDFGTIPKSKGDITKIENYDNLIECIDTIKKMVVEYKQPTYIIDEVSTAINNIQSRKRMFEKSFGMNIEFPVMIYNSTVLSCVSSVSLLITSCIAYVKDGRSTTFEASFNKAAYVKSKDHVLYKYIKGFNDICKNGSFDKLVNECNKNNVKVAKESVILTVGATAFVLGQIVSLLSSGRGLFSNVIFGLRSIVYYFFYMRTSVSEWFSVQADFLAINAENLKYREDKENSDSHRSKVYDNQMKWVERFRKISNFFALKDTKSRKAASDNENDDKKHQDDDESDDGIIF